MSTRTTRASIRKRPSRSIPAVIVALVLLAVAVTAVWSGITVLTGGNTAIVDGISSAADTPWSAQAAYVPSIAVALIGIALIITALVPGRHDTYLLNHDGAAEAALTRKGLKTYLQDQAADIDGVDSVRASTKGRQVGVRINTYALDRRQVEKDLDQRLRGRMNSLNLKHSPRVHIRTSTLKD
ncbi:DUF6286 domain-containing protein [Arthrobacter sp. N1]|uniref:DUF6286 domain-containing protein n=1 Tax=Arthrobacter sp. N1 TaxID=619291 RepID=UPI003BB0220E